MRLWTQYEIKLGVVSALTEMMSIRDKDASDHAMRVRNYAMMIAAKIGITEEQEEELSMAALLHELGEIDISRKSDAGTRASMAGQTIVQAHAECEARLLHAIPELANVAEIISCYGENYDGTGTPRGLVAEQIPLLSRILRLAAEYNQMVRPKASAPMTHDEAMRFLIPRSGKQFDPLVTEVLSQLTPEELAQQQHPMTTQGEYTRLRQDSFEAICVAAVL